MTPSDSDRWDRESDRTELRPQDERRPSARRVAHRVLSDLSRGILHRVGDAIDRSGIQGRDAGFARELSFGVVRRRRLLDFIVEPYLAHGLPEDVRMLNALRVGCYELAFMRTPPHAAVHEAVSMVRGPRSGAVNAVLRRVAESVDYCDDEKADRDARRDDRVRIPGGVLRLREQMPADPVTRLAVEFSLPNFLVERWRSEFGGDAAHALAQASVAVPTTHLRASGALEKGRLEELLREEDVVTERVIASDSEVLRLPHGVAPPIGSAAFGQGAFVIQNYPSVLVGRAVPARAGETVIDYCSAPGTKTVQLAEAVGPSGTVYAYDVDDARRAQIGDNLERMKLDNVRVVGRVDALPEVADHVLVDAPCSNTGVLSRRIEVRERLTERAIAGLVREQRDILHAAARYVRPGGTLVYATCSVEPDENTGVVASLEGFEFVDQRLTLPDPRGLHDGGYFATLRRPSAGS